MRDGHQDGICPLSRQRTVLSIVSMAIKGSDDSLNFGIFYGIIIDMERKGVGLGWVRIVAQLDGAGLTLNTYLTSVRAGNKVTKGVTYLICHIASEHPTTSIHK